VFCCGTFVKQAHSGHHQGRVTTWATVQMGVR
jgi:hypothetical protein